MLDTKRSAPGSSPRGALPTTPNPTSGFLLFVPRRALTTLNMTVEEGIKLVISGGIVAPPDRRPQAIQEAPQISSREAEAEAERARFEASPRAVADT